MFDKRKVIDKFATKLQNAVRVGMVHSFSSSLGSYVVNEYPKSGGTWLGQMLERALDVPFPRNRFPVFWPSIIHGHFLNPWGMDSTVVVWRDGRDVMVSWYHHCLFMAGRHNSSLVEMVRDELPFQNYEGVYENLPTFIEYSFTKQRHPRFSWADFVQRWYRREGIVHVSYEDLHQNAACELQRVVLELSGESLMLEKATEIVEEFSFAQQSGRKPGEENKTSFMRKGVTGDWRNYFSDEACKVFDWYAGEELVLLGYEQDRTWGKLDRER